MHFGDYSGTALKKSCFFDEDIGQDISRFSVEFFQGMAELICNDFCQEVNCKNHHKLINFYSEDILKGF